jgi:biopolymer transport protein ExbD
VAREIAQQNATQIAAAVDAGAASASAQVTVTIDARGAMTLDGHPVNQVELVGQMRARVAADPEVRVVIAADRAASQQSTVGLFDSLRTIGVRHFAMAVAPQ